MLRFCGWKKFLAFLKFCKRWMGYGVVRGGVRGSKPLGAFAAGQRILLGEGRGDMLRGGGGGECRAFKTCGLKLSALTLKKELEV
jgi:hypothetical protein